MFYVYIWRDAIGTPFYVGKGKDKRAWELYNRSEEFKVEHAKGGCSVEIVDKWVLASEALAHERELIARYGRRSVGTGVLVNKSDGEIICQHSPLSDDDIKIENISQEEFDLAYITSSEICKRLSINRSTLASGVKRGLVPDPVKLNGCQLRLWKRQAVGPYLSAWLLHLQAKRGQRILELGRDFSA